MRFTPVRPRRRAPLGLGLAVVFAVLALGLPASASPSGGPSPATANPSAPSARGSSGPGLEAGGENAATTVGVRTATAKAPDDRGFYAYEVQPGGYKVDYLAVTNYSLHPVDVRLLATDATTTPDANFASVGNAAPRDVGAWVSLQTDHLTIPAQSVQIVGFQVSPPHDARPGDHAGALIVSLLANQPKPGSGEIVVDHRVGLRLNLRVPGQLTPKLEISKLRTTFGGFWSGFGVGRMTTTYRVINEGNVTLSGEQVDKYVRSLLLSNVPLKVPATDEILPGGSVDVRVTGPRMFALGPVDTDVKVVAKNATAGVPLPTITKSVTTWVIPWIPVWIIVALVALWVARREWRRRHPRKTGRRAVEPSAGPLNKLVGRVRPKEKQS